MDSTMVKKSIAGGEHGASGVFNDCFLRAQTALSAIDLPGSSGFRLQSLPGWFLRAVFPCYQKGSD